MLLAGVVDGSGPLALGVERVDTPEEAKMWVDRYHDAGFQQMKIYSSVKLEELKDVTAEAHRLGMTVTGHIPEGLNAYQALTRRWTRLITLITSQRSSGSHFLKTPRELTV